MKLNDNIKILSYSIYTAPRRSGFLSITPSCIKSQAVPASLMTVMSPQPPVMKSQNSQHPHAPFRSQSPENVSDFSRKGCHVYSQCYQAFCLLLLIIFIISYIILYNYIIILSFNFACSWTLFLHTDIDITGCLIQVLNKAGFISTVCLPEGLWPNDLAVDTLKLTFLTFTDQKCQDIH